MTQPLSPSTSGRLKGDRGRIRTKKLFDQGLAFDLETLLYRRGMLKLVGAASLGAGLLLAGCGTSSTSSGGTAASGGSASGSAGTAGCAPIPEETAGPYPADGTNGPDVLNQSGIVRRDIRSSFGELTGTAAGVPLTILLAVEDTANGCAPLANAAVYLWHCDRDGNYSLYGVTDQNYLRGVQEADADGIVTFTSIYPACYAGRWPHIHFEVYPNLAAATDAAKRIATSQLALPRPPARPCTRRRATSRAPPTSGRSAWRQTTSSATTEARKNSGGSPEASTLASPWS